MSGVIRLVAFIVSALLLFFVTAYKIPDCIKDCTKTRVLHIVKLALQCLLVCVVLIQSLNFLSVPFLTLLTASGSIITVVAVTLNETVRDLIDGYVYLFTFESMRVGNTVELALDSCDECSVQNGQFTIEKMNPFVMLAVREDGKRVNIRYSTIKTIKDMTKKNES